MNFMGINSQHLYNQKYTIHFFFTFHNIKNLREYQLTGWLTNGSLFSIIFVINFYGKYENQRSIHYFELFSYNGNEKNGGACNYRT